MAKGGGGGFFILGDTLSFGLSRLDGGLAGGVEDTILDFALQAEAEAQANAPWADRTGAAREGLYATVEREGLEIALSLEHSVDYGLWLETIQSGAYAIIMPTLESISGPLFEAVNAKPTGGGIF